MNNYVSFGTHTKDVKNDVQNYDNGSHASKTVATTGQPILWRIVRINEDKSVKLIAEHNIGLPVAWNSKKVADYVNKDGENTSSDIKQIVDSWYEEIFGDTSTNDDNKKLDSLVEKTEFCNDRQDLSSSSSAVRNRLKQSPPQPTLKCEQEDDKVEAKVGLISADEMVYAGALYAKKVTNNTTYLNNKTFFWTISPFSSANAFSWGPYYLALSGDDVSYSDNAAARPVITLSSEAPFTYDKNSDFEPGTENNPWIIG